MRINYINTGCMSGGMDFPIAESMKVISGCEIFVFVEASEKSDGFERFNEQILEEGFKLYKSAPLPKSNQVMIGIKSEIKVLATNELGQVLDQRFTGRGVGPNSVDASEVVLPNYLRVTIEHNDEPTDIIGARIPSYSQYKKGAKLTPKIYNAQLCSFRQMLEALDRDLMDYHKTVLVMDGNNALHHGDFYGPYDPTNYAGKVQKNYNFHILRDELLIRGFILKEKVNESSWQYGIHLDHALFKGFDINAVETKYFFQEGFEHKGISIKL